MSNKGKELITQLGEMKLTPRAMSRWADEFGEFVYFTVKNFDEIGVGISCTDEELKNLGLVSMIDQGGSYHDGGTFWKVFTFEKYEVSLGCQAVYSSWDDHHYDKWKEVIPKDVTVTKWFDEEGNDLDTEL